MNTHVLVHSYLIRFNCTQKIVERFFVYSNTYVCASHAANDRQIVAWTYAWSNYIGFFYRVSPDCNANWAQMNYMNVTLPFDNFMLLLEFEFEGEKFKILSRYLFDIILWYYMDARISSVIIKSTTSAIVMRIFV